MGEAMIPLLLGLAFIGVTLARSVWLWRTTGLNPYVIDHHDPLSRFVAHVFAIVVGAVFVYCAVLAFWPQAEQALGLVTWVAGEATRWAGGTLMVCAIVWTGYAQFAMGSSWRIGIPSEAPPLRTDAAFAVSRNPIFLGMIAFVAGLTLWSPSAVTVALLVAAYISIEVQIRGEEAFLERMHGDAYRRYRARVRRWI
jgi:protein-S-isoprenylcysteine O-methyltransferase Ste14